jgi:signal transduction histidine kinase
MPEDSRTPQDLPSESASGIHDKLPAVSEAMISRFAHDIKSPLSAIGMNLEFALGELQRHPSNDALRGALEDSRLAGAKALRLVADIQDVLRYEAGCLVANRAVVRLDSLVEQVVHSRQAEARTRRLDVSVVGELAPLPVDGEMFERVVASLLEYVFRATRPGGRITFHLRDGGQVQIDLTSDGFPPSPEDRRTLFDREPKGKRGLGLYFCHAAVDAHGGVLAYVEGVGIRLVLAR